jgi:hypothetical protein
MLRVLVIREDREDDGYQEEGYNERCKGAGRLMRKNAVVVYL